MANQKVEEIKKLLELDKQNISNLNELNDFKVKYLGKKGLITELSSEIKNIPNEEKKEFGMLVNELRTMCTSVYEEKKESIEKEILNEKLAKEVIDISLPATKVSVGSPSILEHVVEEVEDAALEISLADAKMRDIHYEIGDIVNVKTGYALNYLVPQGFATVGTASAIKQHEETLRQRAHKEAKLIADAQAVAAKAAAVEIKISAKVGENGKLYGGITAGQVAEILAGAGVEVEKRNITLPEIKAVGEYEATAKIYKSVVATLKVEVVAE